MTMKTKHKFFHRKLEPALEGLEKKLSNLSVILIILAGIFYIISSVYILANIYGRDRDFKNLGMIVIIGTIISTSGVGLIISRPPKQRIYWATLLFILLMFCSFYQFYFLKILSSRF